MSALSKVRYTSGDLKWAKKHEPFAQIQCAQCSGTDAYYGLYRYQADGQDPDAKLFCSAKCRRKFYQEKKDGSRVYALQF